MELYQASHQWATRPADQRFETPQALRDSVHGRRLRSRSADVALTSVSVALNKAGRLTVNSGITPSEPTHWSFGQLAGNVGAPGSYLRTLSPDLVVANMNYGLKHGQVRADAKFMTIASDDDARPNTLQAVTSTTYGRIWDADCIESVQRIVDRSGGKFHNPKAYSPGGGAEPRPSGLYASDHDVFMFMIDGGSMFEAGPRAKFHRGFICWNSETGARTVGLMTFLFNVVCGNHIIWGATDVNQLIIRHCAGGPARFDAQAMPALAAYVNASARPEEAAIQRAQKKLLPEDREGLDKLVAPFKFTRGEVSEAIAAAKREEGDCRTLWNLVQGLTAYARGFDFVDSRVDLERRAGKLLDLVAE